MIGPSADELAAIAAAYAALTSRRADAAAASVPEASRWSLAGRLPVDGDRDAVLAARSASRWSAAGRLDG